MPESIYTIANEARSCTFCAGKLPLRPRPVFQVGLSAKILVVGQAPGRRVHETGVPFNDPSGVRLRDWMGINRETFYDASKIALLPMAFCFPGTGSGGDLPPISECADLWRERFLKAMPQIEFTILCGQYAISWHLPERRGFPLTATVREWRQLGKRMLPLPHPSPRNNRWLARNPWFELEVLPYLRHRVKHLISFEH